MITLHFEYSKKEIIDNDFTQPSAGQSNSFNLNSLKEIVNKNSFLTLEKNIRGCQEESYDDCTTKKYLHNLKNKCECLPFQLIQEDNKVCIVKEFCLKCFYINVLVDTYLHP